MLTEHVRTIGCCTLMPGEEYPTVVVPSVSCFKTAVGLKIPEFFESEELGISPQSLINVVETTKTFPFEVQ